MSLDSEPTKEVAPKELLLTEVSMGAYFFQNSLPVEM